MTSDGSSQGTLRQRKPTAPPTQQQPQDSAPQQDTGTTPPFASSPLKPVRPGARRHRSHSMRQSSHRKQQQREQPTGQTVPFISLAYPSSLLESLDLPKSMWNLRDMLLGKLDQAEQDVQKLREWSEAEDTPGDTTGVDSDDEDDTEHDWQVVTSSKRRNVHRRNRQRPQSPPSDGSGDDDEDDTAADAASRGTLRQFAQAASEFLSALRSELPTMQYRPATPSSPVIQWELSPEAREALDKFLDDHPLPTFPQLGLRARATDSANALLARVSDELASLRDMVSGLNRPTSPFSSYLPSPHARMSDLREYFSAESARLGQRFTPSSVGSHLRHLRDETADSLHAGIAKMQDGASELSAMVSSKSHHALDEAARLYHVALAMGRERLLHYEELPHDWRNNPYVLSGYRFVEIDRWGALLRSGFEWHNETINIQSHFIGFLSLCYLLVCIFPNSVHYLPGAHPADQVVALLFIGAAMKCLLCSVAWHLFAGCATGHWHRGAACVDYVGISGLIAASVIGIEYYGFYCEPRTAAGYMAFSAVCGVVGMILPWKPWFNEREFKLWRIAFFLSLAGSALTPIAHLAYLYGLKETVTFFFPVALSAVAYLVGLTFYAHQFPECVAPGRWDHLLASHQLWHVAIVCAVWLHWGAMTTWNEAVRQGVDLSCRVR